MSSMSIQELYDYLNSPEFQNVKNGNIFYNYYIYQYPAKKEYEMRRQLVVFKQNLERPTSFVNAMLLERNRKDVPLSANQCIPHPL